VAGGGDLDRLGGPAVNCSGRGRDGVDLEGEPPVPLTGTAGPSWTSFAGGCCWDGGCRQMGTARQSVMKPITSEGWKPMAVILGSSTISWSISIFPAVTPSSSSNVLDRAVGIACLVAVNERDRADRSVIDADGHQFTSS
jgi:hypothetical protein